MYHDDVDKIANTSANKVKIVEESFTKYFGCAVMAGIFYHACNYTVIYNWRNTFSQLSRSS
ncbi:hypothetical protein CNEO4_1280032 [Clostridium neonatale]|nr:hypothetical protein CNEO4_1280032 [Clostridium neonatale]